VQSASDKSDEIVDVHYHRRRTYSLAQMLGGVTLASLWFAVMYYSVSLGVALGVIVLLLVVRVRWHRYTAWKLGWRLTPMLLITTAIFSMMAAAFVFAIVNNGLSSSYLSTSLYPELELRRDLSSWREVVRSVSRAFALIAFETVVVFSLRRIRPESVDSRPNTAI
jgi:hypothetical protein